MRVSEERGHWRGGRVGSACAMCPTEQISPALSALSIKIVFATS